MGSAVNRAARLLCPAKPGQILAEAPVMESVLMQWLSAGRQMPLDTVKARGSAFLDSGAPFSPAASPDASVNMSRNKSAPNVMLRLKSGKAELQRLSSNAAVASDSMEAGSLSHTMLLPTLQTPPGMGRTVSKQGVHFAAGVAQASKSPMGLPWGGKAPPRKSVDGVDYDDDELETPEASESCCQPFAADSPLAVSNCHMLQFLADLDPQHARRDAGLVKQTSMGSGNSGATQGSAQSPPKASSRFADVVARAVGDQKAGGESSTGQICVEARSADPRQKGLL